MDIGSLSNYYTDYLTKNASNAKTDALRNDLNTKDYANATDEELMDACKQFEAYFIEQVYKGMEKTIIRADDSTSSSNETLVNFYKDEMYQKLSAKVADSGDLGLAQKMYEQMKRNYGSVSPVSLSDTQKKTDAADTVSDEE